MCACARRVAGAANWREEIVRRMELRAYPENACFRFVLSVSAFKVGSARDDGSWRRVAATRLHALLLLDAR